MQINEVPCHPDHYDMGPWRTDTKVTTESLKCIFEKPKVKFHSHTKYFGLNGFGLELGIKTKLNLKMFKMFKMKWTKALALMVLCGIFLSHIQPAEGLMCVKCQDCHGTSVVTESNCETAETGNDRCFKEINKEGKFTKHCTTSENEEANRIANNKCDEFNAVGVKTCFCASNYCNEATFTNGFSKFQTVFNFLASASAYFIVNLVLVK